MLILSSAAFTHEGEMPARYTCQGDDQSPPLSWQGVPAGTRSLALIVDDPDAPDPAAPKMTWVHWVIYNMAPTVSGIAEGASSTALPAGAVEGRNDFRRVRYGGPCPPIGRHRYFHKLYALDALLPTDRLMDKTELVQAMAGHVLAEAHLIGTYLKHS